MAINYHETCQRAQSLPQQQTRAFSNIYNKLDQIYLDLKQEYNTVNICPTPVHAETEF